MGSASGTFGALVVGLVVGGVGVYGYLTQRPLANPFREGQVFMQKSKFPEASAAFAEALKLEPENSAARIALGASLQAQGKTDEALDAYQVAESSTKETLAQFYGNLATLHMQRNNPIAAQDSYAKQAVFRAQLGQGGVPVTRPNPAGATFHAGRVAEQSGNVKEAIRKAANDRLATLKKGKLAETKKVATPSLAKPNRLPASKRSYR